MPFLTVTSLVLAGISVGLVVLLLARPSLTVPRGGKILAFFAFFTLPLLSTWSGAESHIEQSKSTSFCLSCHEMKPYGESLKIDDPGHLPASHYQNRRISRDQACFTCHTTYTLFGDARAKLQGLRHVYVHYLGEPPAKLALYQPYHNRECLHCHLGARGFEENEFHVEARADLIANTTSCLECHDAVHAVAKLAELPKWEPAK